jgi:hypothetical protein
MTNRDKRKSRLAKQAERDRMFSDDFDRAMDAVADYSNGRLDYEALMAELAAAHKNTSEVHHG